MNIEYDASVGLLTILAVGIFTPGPNNITAISHSAVHGARSNISLLIGMVIGFVSVHLIIGSVIEQIDEESVFFSLLEWFGILFFVALGIIILRLPIERLSVDQDIKRLDFRHGIGLQFINGKEWAFIIIMMSQFMQPFGGGMIGIGVIVLISLTICVSVMIGWTFFGHRLNNYFTDPRIGKRIFNISGILLGLLWVAFLIQGPPVPVI